MRRALVVGMAVGIGLLGIPLVPAEAEPGAPDPADVAAAAVRTACDVVWIDSICAPVAYTDPGYRTAADPTPSAPYQLRIGATHEHSGYSDGDPTTRPSDYFTTARTGHNVADAGGDTGVALDFLMSSEHSENEKIPITTAEVCLTDPAAAPGCLLNVAQADHYRKWEEARKQALEGSDVTAGAYTGFTGMRGFEFTNDYYNHLGVYLGRNVVNAKIDGSYLTTEAFWAWLRKDASKGGGSDALVTFNHPGGDPALSPFDGDLPTGALLQALLGGANWHDLANVPSVDDQVSGIAVNGGDDLGWYVKALTKGWHLGPFADEDEHQREWSSSDEGKTVMLTRGRSPKDYYWALKNNRTMAYGKDVVNGSPGTHAQYPSVLFWADGASVNAPGAKPLGTRLVGGGHSLELDAQGLAPGSRAVLVSKAGGTPVALGTAAADGKIRASRSISAPALGEGWWFVVICGADSTDCGRDDLHDVVTSPIWLRAA